MKLLLLVALCAGAAFAVRSHDKTGSWERLHSEGRIEETVFRAGREYRFAYNGQLSSGIPGSSKQHSAHRFRAWVTVSFESDNQAVLQMTDFRMGKLNREISHPRMVLPLEAFEQVSIPEYLNAKLQMVAKFSYDNGLVRNVVFDERDDSWSSNIKRAVLNMLQVDLQKQRRLDTDETRSRRVAQSPVEVGDSSFYRVMEDTLEGECETIYTVHQLPHRQRPSSPVLNVTKSINFEKCKKRPEIKYNFRFTETCPTCDSKYNDDEQFVKSSTVFKYNISGTEQSFMIESARVESEYIFTPFNEQSNIVITYVNQTLVLVKTGPIQSHIRQPERPAESNPNLIFTLNDQAAVEKFLMTEDKSEMHKLHNNSKVNVIQLGEKFLRKIVEKTQRAVDDDVPRNFVRLVTVLRLSDESEIERIFESRQSLPEEQKKHVQDLIPQLLGTCGSKACIKLLSKKIQNGQIKTLKAILAVRSLINSRVVSKEIIHELLQLVESEKVRENEHLKRHIWLSIGSLVNAICSKNEDQLAVEYKESSQKLCSRDAKENYVKIFFEKFRQSNKWEDKIVLLKTIGNAGLDVSIMELEKIIRQQDQQYPMYVRFEAIAALRELTDVMQKKIQRVLMPVISDRRENVAVRASASTILLQTVPDRAILDQLARSLISEPSHQFASFLYTQMNALANSTNPCEQKLATDLKLALRNAKKITAGFGYSQKRRLSLHSHEQSIGLDIDHRAIFSNTSSMPRMISAAFSLNALGFWHKHLAAVNLFNDGLLETLWRKYRQESDIWQNSNEEDDDQPQRRHPRDTGSEYERELREIFGKHLRIRSRDFSQEYENTPKAYISGTYKSHASHFLPISKDTLRELISYGAGNLLELRQQLSRGLPVDYASVSNLHDAEYSVPTTFGLLMTVNIIAPVAWHVKGQLRGEMESNGKIFKLQAELKPSAVAVLSAEVSFWSPIVSTGVKIDSKVKLFAPIDADLRVELAAQPTIAKLTFKTPSEKRDLLVLESRPTTYVRDWQRFVKEGDDADVTDYKTIFGDEVNRVTSYNKCGSIWGVQFCSRGQTHYTPMKSVKGTPFFPFNGPNKLVVSVEPNTGSPREFELELSSKWLMPSEDQSHRPSFTSFTPSVFSDSEGSHSSESTERSSETETSTEHRRHQQQSHSNVDHLQQYRNYQMKKSFKNQLTLAIRSDGNRPLLTADLTSLADMHRRYGKVDLRVRRQHPEEWQACFDAELMFPETPAFVDDVTDKKIMASAQLLWGRTCQSENFVRLSAQAERSSQQSKWERRQSQYKAYRTAECEGEKTRCSPLAQEQFVEEISRMLKYRLNVEYSHVSPAVQNITNKIYRAIKNYYYWQTDVNEIDVQNQEGKITAQIIIDPETRQRVNITLKTPKENARLQDLPLPVAFDVLFNQKKPFAEQFSDIINADDEQGECRVRTRRGVNSRSQIETFDGVKYSVPFTSCWSVLAKDCSSDKPKFAVLIRKSERSADQKEIKIVTAQHRIELMPESERYDSLKVTVNGQQQQIEGDHELLHHDHVVARIEKHPNTKTMTIELIEAGVEIEFDGYTAAVKLNDEHLARQCGLCGHYDLESQDEFRNPDFTEESDLRQFFLNYMIKDERCQAPRQLQDVCTDETCEMDDSSETSASSSSSSSSSSEEHDGDNDDTTEKTQLKIKIVEQDDKMCFSTEPIPQCDDDSYPIEIKQTKKVDYICIDQDDQSAEHLERLVRKGANRLPTIRNRQPTFSRTEKIPEKCKEYTRN